MRRDSLVRAPSKNQVPFLIVNALERSRDGKKSNQALAVVRNIPYTRVMSTIENIAKLTSKSQTTVPIAVRKALSVGPHDQISFTVLDGGRVEVRKVESSDQDPVVQQYLAFLEKDMMVHPEKLSVIQRDETMRKLLEGVETESFDLSD